MEDTPTDSVSARILVYMGLRDRFDKIFLEYYPKLIVFCMHSAGCGRHDAEDLAQDILSKAYEKSWRYDERYALSTWLYRIGRNKCIDWRRKTCRRRIESAYPAEGLPADAAHPEECLIRSETADTVSRFMESLAPDDRMIAYLRFYEDMPYAELARVLKKPEGTLKYRVNAIRRHLRTFMEEWYGIRR